MSNSRNHRATISLAQARCRLSTKQRRVSHFHQKATAAQSDAASAAASKPSFRGTGASSAPTALGAAQLASDRRRCESQWTADSRDRCRGCRQTGKVENRARVVDPARVTARRIARRDPHQFPQSAISRRVPPCGSRPLANRASGLPFTFAGRPSCSTSNETRPTALARTHARPRFCIVTPIHAVVFSPCVCTDTASWELAHGCGVLVAAGCRIRSSLSTSA